MSNAELLEDIQIELTGSELPTHLVCTACYPEDVPVEGDRYAICGALLAGIYAPLKTLDCEKCVELYFEPCPVCGMPA